MSDDLVEKLNSMPKAEAIALVDRMFFEAWGVTREKMMTLSNDEIMAIAEARGRTVAGIGNGGELFQYVGDGKDKRN